MSYILNHKRATPEQVRNKTKICNQCLEEKVKETHFYKAGGGDGFQAKCIYCQTKGKYIRRPNYRAAKFESDKLVLNVGNLPNENRKISCQERLKKFNKPDLMPKGNWWKLLLDTYDWKCCKCSTETDLQHDHVIPISWPEGEHSLENSQLLCADCNYQKNNKTCADYRQGNIIKIDYLQTV